MLCWAANAGHLEFAVLLCSYKKLLPGQTEYNNYQPLDQAY